MRLSKMSRIRFGRENKNISKRLRKDIIYKVYLGDRQIWEKTKNDEEDKVKEKKPRLDYYLKMIWYVYDFLVLGNVTSATSIVGTINWGDGTEEEWKSGNTYYHKYAINGDYTVTLYCQQFYPAATIGQIDAYHKKTTPENERSYLKGISFCKIPYLHHKLFENLYASQEPDPRPRMFQATENDDYNKLETVIMPLDTDHTEDNMFYGAALRNITINGNVKSLGYNCFVRREEEDDQEEALNIKIEQDDVDENVLTVEKLINSGIGYKIKNNGKALLKTINVICSSKIDSSIVNYFTNLGANITIIEEPEDEEQGNSGD